MQTGKTTPRASQGIRYALLVFLVVMVSLPAFSQSRALGISRPPLQVRG